MLDMQLKKICLCLLLFFLRRLKLLIVFFFKLVDFLQTMLHCSLELVRHVSQRENSCEWHSFQTCTFHNKVNNQFQSVKMSNNELKFQLFGGNWSYCTLTWSTVSCMLPLHCTTCFYASYNLCWHAGSERRSECTHGEVCVVNCKRTTCLFSKLQEDVVSHKHRKSCSACEAPPLHTPCVMRTNSDGLIWRSFCTAYISSTRS